MHQTGRIRKVFRESIIKTNKQKSTAPERYLRVSPAALTWRDRHTGKSHTGSTLSLPLNVHILKETPEIRN